MEAAILALDGGGRGRMAVHEIGRSHEGRSIYAVQVAEPNAAGELPLDRGDRPALLVECGIHAREWAGPELCLKFLQAMHLGSLFDPDRVHEIVEQATI